MSVRRCLTTKILVFLVCILLIVVIPSSKGANSQTNLLNSFPFLENNKIAVLQGLDKVTARISTLYALEHAVYDVWVVDCTNSSNSSNTKFE